MNNSDNNSTNTNPFSSTKSFTKTPKQNTGFLFNDDDFDEVEIDLTEVDQTYKQNTSSSLNSNSNLNSQNNTTTGSKQLFESTIKNLSASLTDSVSEAKVDNNPNLDLFSEHELDDQANTSLNSTTAVKSFSTTATTVTTVNTTLSNNNDHTNNISSYYIDLDNTNNNSELNSITNSRLINSDLAENDSTDNELADDDQKPKTNNSVDVDDQDFNSIDQTNDFNEIKELTSHINLEQLHRQQASQTQDLETTIAKLSAQTSRQDELIQGLSNYESPEFIYTEESINQATPMLKQYLTIKRNHQDKILFFRMGDFYEFFFEDAVITSKVLNIAISSRQTHMGVTVPMAGIPHHAFEAYASKMVAQGYSIAICEQTSDPKAKGLTERDVIRIFTPGTLSEDSYLPARESKPLVAIYSDYLHYVVAILDVSSGFVEASILDNYQEFLNRIQQYNPAEIIYQDANLLSELISSKYHLTKVDPDFFNLKSARENIKAIYGKSELIKFEDYKFLIPPTGALIRYVQATQMVQPSHLQPVRLAHENSLVILDNATINNLELFMSNSGNKSTAFIEVLDNCCSAMGARLFRRWVRQPTRNLIQLNSRLDQVQTFLEQDQARQQIRQYLKNIGDIERIVARISLGNVSPRDLGELRNNLLIIPQINQLLQQYQLDTNILDELTPIRDLLFAALEDKQPLLLRDGNVIRSSFNARLCELRDMHTNILGLLDKFEQQEKQKTGIETLTIKLSNANEIFINIPKSGTNTANLDKVPDNYIFKQSLKNAQRYYTTELRQLEVEYAQSEILIADIERSIFNKIVQALKQQLKFIQNLANQLSRLDVFCGFAQLAYDNNYVRPQFNTEHKLQITAGRHPVIEKLLSNPFIPNDSDLSSTKTLAIITGPNMGGKSTYMRQNALISLMALIGSYVPADYANIPLFDKILTRIGASDDISTGKSTFMVEMSEMSYILENASADSLLLIDEIGRGTSTFDGLSLAWACAQFIAQKVKALTFFSTHYFELTSLAKHLDNVKNLYVSAIEHNDEISCLHEVHQGVASKSYGIAVAKLAGLPEQVLAIAQHQLNLLSQSAKSQTHTSNNSNHTDDSLDASAAQNEIESLSTVKSELTVVTPQETQQLAQAQEYKQVIDGLTKVDPNNLTPMQALELIMELKALAETKA